MFTSIKDFEASWKSESKFTQSVIDVLTDASLSQAVNNDHRTIGRMAWHICETIPEMMGQLGLSFDEFNSEVPKDVKTISKTYAKYSKALLDQIVSGWSDETLQQEDNLYGEIWKRGNTLLIFIKHEIHHRGQITVLMRQAGIVVPSIYGPAKEGWKEYGAEPPVI